MFDIVPALCGFAFGLSGGLSALCFSLRKRLREAQDNQAALLDRLSARSLAEYHAISAPAPEAAELKHQMRTLSDPIAGLVHMKVKRVVD